MRPAWAVAVAAASLAADRSGKDNAVASRTIPARARRPLPGHAAGRGDATAHRRLRRRRAGPRSAAGAARQRQGLRVRSEEHTSELQSLMRISYAVFCLKKKKQNTITNTSPQKRSLTKRQHMS